MQYWYFSLGYQPDISTVWMIFTWITYFRVECYKGLHQVILLKQIIIVSNSIMGFSSVLECEASKGHTCRGKVNRFLNLFYQWLYWIYIFDEVHWNPTFFVYMGTITDIMIGLVQHYTYSEVDLVSSFCPCGTFPLSVFGTCVSNPQIPLAFQMLGMLMATCLLVWLWPGDLPLLDWWYVYFWSLKKVSVSVV